MRLFFPMPWTRHVFCNAKMKKTLITLIVAAAVVAGCGKFSAYDTYTSPQELLGFSWQVPRGWGAQEFRHPNLEAAGVTFSLEPGERDPYRSFFSVTAVRLPEDKRGGVVSLREVARQSLAKAFRLQDARLVTRGGRMIDGETAAEAVITYKGMSDIYKAGAPMVPVKERFLVFLRDDFVVTIRYVGLEAAFEDNDAAFSHGLETLRFH